MISEVHPRLLHYAPTLSNRGYLHPQPDIEVMSERLVVFLGLVDHQLQVGAAGGADLIVTVLDGSESLRVGVARVAAVVIQGHCRTLVKLLRRSRWPERPLFPLILIQPVRQKAQV